MRRRIMMYLEDYARRLDSEAEALLDQEINDFDPVAGVNARTLLTRSQDVRRVVAFFSRNTTITLVE